MALKHKANWTCNKCGWSHPVAHGSCYWCDKQPQSNGRSDGKAAVVAKQPAAPRGPRSYAAVVSGPAKQAKPKVSAAARVHRPSWADLSSAEDDNSRSDATSAEVVALKSRLSIAQSGLNGLSALCADDIHVIEARDGFIALITELTHQITATKPTRQRVHALEGAVVNQSKKRAAAEAAREAARQLHFEAGVAMDQAEAALADVEATLADTMLQLAGLKA